MDLWTNALKTVVCSERLREILAKLYHAGRYDISACVGKDIKKRLPAAAISFYGTATPPVICEGRISHGNWRDQLEFWFEAAGEKWLRNKCAVIRHRAEQDKLVEKDSIVEGAIRKSGDENEVVRDLEDEGEDEGENGDEVIFRGGVKAVHFIGFQYTPPNGPNGSRSVRYGIMLAEDDVPGAEPRWYSCGISRRGVCLLRALQVSRYH